MANVGMTKLVFHLGDYKTGSTAIQTTLASHAYESAKAVFYPWPSLVHHASLARTFDEKAAVPHRAARFAELKREIEKNNAEYTVISAEQFETVDPVALKQAILSYLPGYLDRTRFIAYVRPHADRLISGFSETIKVGHMLDSVESFHDQTLRNGRFKYTPRFSRWRDTFGEAFELRPAIRETLFKRDVVADFMDFALEGAAFTATGLPDGNESLCLEDWLVVRHFQDKLIAKHMARPLVRMLLGRTLGRRFSMTPPERLTKLRLHRSLAEQIAVDYREDATALDAAFFDGTPISSALAEAPGKANPEPHDLRLEAHFSPDEVRMIDVWSEFAADMIEAMPPEFEHRFRQTQNAILSGARPVANGDDRSHGQKKSAGRRKVE